MKPHDTAASGARWDFRTDRTLVDLLALNATHQPEGVALREKDRGIWQQTTWAQWLDEVLCCAAGLASLGFGPHDGLVVLGDNRPHLYSGMLAAGALRGHAMPVYPDATPDEIRHVVEQSGARYVLAEDQEQVDKMLDLRETCPHIDHVIYDDPRGMGAYTDAGLLSWSSLVAQGRASLQADPSLRDALLTRAQPNDIAVFIHSSGTTGKPKGVMLSHSNVISGVANAYRAKSFDFGEEILAYLPMAWIGDFAITLGAGIALRFTINIPESAETVLHNLREIAPTYYLAAPRSWDNMLTMVQVRMEDSTPLKKALYTYFMDAALRIERHKLTGGTASLADSFTRWLGEWLVYGPIKDQLGLSRLRHAFTGGEAIGEDTFVFYRALGVKLRQLYGQTETSAFNAMQDVDEVRLHTVGRPLPGVEARINDDGEILIKSGSVFQGYYRNEESTRKTLRDGWLHTGDAGYLEEDGHLVVLGRLSEVVYTAQGERYIPNYIENRLKFSPYIKDVAVLGSGRDTLAAMICIDMESVGHWAELRGLSYMSYSDLSQKEPVMDLLVQAVERLNATLPEPLRLRTVVSLHKEFDADDGEITRTRKLRRNVVEERYAPIIEAIYAGQSEVSMKARIVYETGEEGVMERRLAIRKV
ncbi:MAG: long-chain fatty acid--CoA ligase [Limnohabitans sp.]|nr:long-chain fatty acid--CoA ligase [Limnohabitans sp.]